MASNWLRMRALHAYLRKFRYEYHCKEWGGNNEVVQFKQSEDQAYLRQASVQIHGIFTREQFCVTCTNATNTEVSTMYGR